jgi:hypothetical protein
MKSRERVSLMPGENRFLMVKVVFGVIVQTTKDALSHFVPLMVQDGRLEGTEILEEGFMIVVDLSKTRG